MRALLLMMLFLPLLSQAAEEVDPGPQKPAAIQLAEEYMAALTNRNYSKLAQFYDRETVLTDQMAGKSLTGSRDILAFLRRVHTYTQEYYFNADHLFYKGSRVVMIGNYYYKARGDLFGYPGESVTFSLPGVTTLKLDMENRRIEQQIDYLDYHTMEDQLSAHPSLAIP
ncbi:nuclear transport factor 2 family protein [Ferrimonas balearica]|uniref:nuclear transport factor 2 family protein n=1 Tax=Ferrimonas balearica TaxID=44012 RepID=UPI001C570032|nr:nuclear transport factor 2 family protein [Ferrimonas balearica]MBY6018819.1 nuclear transport factor 2 family protein [Halomonas denitrificans]MBW3140659.1 nuclear transport factor 2 family protein [Ferrimonas balearica]MBY6096009.1 nuclear transport factor 2 family protein [Ferrimonas balearica]MBY6107536.1 nuclear transport factor 2 family protein [Ferrimonas balearica]MBY6226342.1 nuclear transport factor 2 family protein [Ferrimonas balearica]